MKVSTWVELQFTGIVIDHTIIQRAVERAFLLGTQDGRAPLLDDPLSVAAWTVSVLITDDDEMQRLNREFRGVDKPTDVLSFSMLEGAGVVLPESPEAPLGEIAISYPYVLRQADELGHSPQKELAWLVIHGALQLLGFAHETDEDAQLMEELEQEALLAFPWQMRAQN